MNAATVSGPRSRIKSAICNLKSALRESVLLHRDEYLAIAAPEEDPRDAPGRHFLQLGTRVLRARYRPAVDRQNHVSRAQETGRRSIRVHVADERAAPSGRYLQSARDRRREIAQRDPESAAGLIVRRLVVVAIVAAVRALFCRQIELVNRDVERFLLL